MKRLLIFGLLCMSFYAAPAQFKYGRTVTIDKPVFEDLYVTGGNIIINAPIHGDLVAAGGTIQINDTVTNDILIAGGNVTFNGYAGDDIRCAGGTLHILKPVAGDLVVTGGTITVARNVTIGGLMASGGDLLVDGDIRGNIKTMSGKLELNGNAMKDIDCRGGTITVNGHVQGDAVLAGNDNIFIGNNAVFEGRVRYWRPGKPVDFKQSVRNGQAVYDDSLRFSGDRWYFLGFSSVLGLMWYAGMALLLIMLIQYLFSNTMKNAGTTAYDTALKSFGYGMLFWIGVPVAAAVALISVVGVPVGLILLLCYVALLLTATSITAVVAANWLNNRSIANWNYWRMVFAAFGIFVVLKILTFTPFLGWFIWAVLICICFGAIILNIKWRRSIRPGKQETEPVRQGSFAAT